MRAAYWTPYSLWALSLLGLVAALLVSSSVGVGKELKRQAEILDNIELKLNDTIIDEKTRDKVRDFLRKNPLLTSQRFEKRVRRIMEQKVSKTNGTVKGRPGGKNRFIHLPMLLGCIFGTCNFLSKRHDPKPQVDLYCAAICSCKDTDRCVRPSCPASRELGCPPAPECHPACRLESGAVVLEGSREPTTTTTSRPRVSTTSSSTSRKPTATKIIITRGTTSQRPTVAETTMKPLTVTIRIDDNGDSSYNFDDDDKKKDKDKETPKDLRPINFINITIIQPAKYQSIGGYLFEKVVNETYSEETLHRDSLYQLLRKEKTYVHVKPDSEYLKEQSDLLRYFGDKELAKMKEVKRETKGHNRINWDTAEKLTLADISGKELLGHLADLFSKQEQRKRCSCPKVRCMPTELRECEGTCINVNGCPSYRCKCTESTGKAKGIQ